jgi:hypothetical protein
MPTFEQQEEQVILTLTFSPWRMALLANISISITLYKS